MKKEQPSIIVTSDQVQNFLRYFSLLLIIVGLGMMIWGVGGYVFKNDPEVEPNKSNISTTPNPTESLTNSKDGENKGEILEGISIDKAKAEEIEKMNSSASKWKATNYKPGDITKGTYIVKRGDTLWEIAEAVYGNGSKWKLILQKNKSKIGFLPNGQQAKIIPGQSLVL